MADSGVQFLCSSAYSGTVAFLKAVYSRASHCVLGRLMYASQLSFREVVLSLEGPGFIIQCIADVY